MTTRQYTMILLVASLLMLGCKKQDEWLDKKLNKNDVVPTTFADFQALLNAEATVNFSYTNLGAIGADNYYLFDNDLATVQPSERNAYLWAQVVFPDPVIVNWSDAYKRVMYCNVVLEGLQKVERNVTNQADYDALIGSALFFRAFQFYDMVQTFSAPYNKSKLDLPGIPVRTSADANVRSVRGTIGQTYDRIISDLKKAIELLPAATAFTTRPNKVSTKALLARIYLAMGDYVEAEKYAQDVLDVNSALIDFNTLSKTAIAPFPAIEAKNPEVLFYAVLASTLTLSVNYLSNADTTLYKQYQPGDLRKDIFFRYIPTPIPRALIKGGYTGNQQLFAGLATNEMLLIRAECRARRAELPGALSDINNLLSKRFVTGGYTAFSSTVQKEVLDFVLAERRKELPFTGQLRWEDLRRLNQDPAYATEPKRVVAGQSYTLPAGSPRYVYPIPGEEIRFFGLEQNPR